MKISSVVIFVGVSLLANGALAQATMPTAAGAATPAPAAAANTTAIIDAEFAQISTDLGALQKSKDSKYAEDANGVLLNIHEPNLQNQIDEKVRAEKTKAYVMLLEALRVSLDPRYPDAPEYQARMNVSPPIAVGLTGDGKVFPYAGMDPNAISDPKLRQQYLDAIAENGKKIANSNREADLRRDLVNMKSEFIVYINNAYGETPGWKAEVLSAVKEAGASEELQKDFAKEMQ